MNSEQAAWFSFFVLLLIACGGVVSLLIWWWTSWLQDRVQQQLDKWECK